MPTFYGAIDLSKNELRNAVVQNLPSAPGSPVQGQVYYDSTAKILYWWNGTAWIAAQAAAGAIPASSVTTQAVGDAPVVGAMTTFAREDHKHGREAFGAVTAETVFGTASGNGAAATLARSDHTHGNPLHDAAAHANVPLNALLSATGSYDMGVFRITGLGTPTAGLDAANKSYVDNLVTGLSWKQACRCYAAANLPLNGIPSSGLTDGVTVAVGDRVLVNNQSTPAQNGIYVAAAGAWTRSTDADVGAELVNATVYLSEGVTYADTQWTCVTNAPITIGTTTVSFQQIAGAGTYQWGNGLTNVGNTVNVNPGTGITIVADAVTVDTTVIATVASVTAGDAANAPNTRLINTTAPLTGGGNLSADRTLAITNFAGTAAAGAVPGSAGGTTQFLRADGTWAAPAGGVGKYAAALVGTSSPEVVTHNLNTRDVQVTVLNGASPYTAVEVDWDATSVNTVTIRFNPNLGAGYRVVVVG
jgi:hypothetical protein